MEATSITEYTRISHINNKLNKECESIQLIHINDNTPSLKNLCLLYQITMWLKYNVEIIIPVLFVWSLEFAN